MKINYTYFIVGFLLFFLVKFFLNDFALDSSLSIFLWALLAGLLTSLLMSKRNKPIKDLNLELKQGEEIQSVFYVSIKQTKFHWIYGNLYVTNKRICFVDKLKGNQQCNYDFQFNDIKELLLLPEKFLKSERIKINTTKNEVFYVNAFENNKQLYGQFETKQAIKS